jgi:DNA-binding CsgD family transcriptional regulator
MLVRIQPDPPSSGASISVPSWLQPLVSGPAQGVAFPQAVGGVLKHLGFDTMVYGARGNGPLDERVFIWTNAPPDWVREYDQNSYVEIDPRIKKGREMPLPLVWDNASLKSTDPQVRIFLKRASHYGIGSGLAVYFINDTYAVMVSLNRPEKFLTAAARHGMEKRMGDSLHFASVFHWVFMREVITRGLRPLQKGSPLSRREMQCLHFAAHGMTSNDIAVKLGITERTANFHFSNLISKLGVLNRQEAVATAVANGLVRLHTIGDARSFAYVVSRKVKTKR